MKNLINVFVLTTFFNLQAMACDCIAEVSGNMNNSIIRLIDADADVILYEFTERGTYDISLPPANDVYVQYDGRNGARLTIDCGGPITYDSGVLTNPQEGTVGDDVLNCSSLPVEWGRLTTDVNGSSVYFQIETLSETSVKSFQIIWYDPHTRTEKVLTEINADNAVHGSDYFYMAKFGRSGSYPWKVREIDFDGRYTDSHWCYFEIESNDSIIADEYYCINLFTGEFGIYHNLDSIPKVDTLGRPIPYVINGSKVFLVND